MKHLSLLILLSITYLTHGADIIVESNTVLTLTTHFLAEKNETRVAVLIDAATGTRVMIISRPSGLAALILPPIKAKTPPQNNPAKKSPKPAEEE